MEPFLALSLAGGLGLVAAVAVLVVGALGLMYLSRQGTLSRRVGSFACHLRQQPGAGQGSGAPGDGHRWSAGHGQYCTDRLIWWRTLSLAPRPARTWSRTELELVGRDQLADRDESGSPLLLVHCRHRGETFGLRMSASACAGLVSWLESAPRVAGRAH